MKHDDIYNLFFLRVYKWNQMDLLGFICFHLYGLRKKKTQKSKNIFSLGIFWDFNPWMMSVVVPFPNVTCRPVLLFSLRWWSPLHRECPELCNYLKRNICKCEYSLIWKNKEICKSNFDLKKISTNVFTVAYVFLCIYHTQSMS